MNSINKKFKELNFISNFGETFCLTYTEYTLIFLRYILDNMFLFFFLPTLRTMKIRYYLVCFITVYKIRARTNILKKKNKSLKLK